MSSSDAAKPLASVARPSPPSRLTSRSTAVKRRRATSCTQRAAVTRDTGATATTTTEHTHLVGVGRHFLEQREEGYHRDRVGLPGRVLHANERRDVHQRRGSHLTRVLLGAAQFRDKRVDSKLRKRVVAQQRRANGVAGEVRDDGAQHDTGRGWQRRRGSQVLLEEGTPLARDPRAAVLHEDNEPKQAEREEGKLQQTATA